MSLWSSSSSWKIFDVSFHRCYRREYARALFHIWTISSFCVRQENARSISVPQSTWKNCRWRKLMQRKPFRMLIGDETVLHNYFSGSAAVSLDMVFNEWKNQTANTLADFRYCRTRFFIGSIAIRHTTALELSSLYSYYRIFK